MPIYDYICLDCGGQETMQAIPVDSRNNQKCSKCNGPLKIKIGKFAVVYNCGGFAHQELEMDRFQHEVDSAQAEGFRSQTEIEVSVEQGLDRAAKNGIDPRKIVGQEVLETGKVPALEDSFAEMMG